MPLYGIHFWTLYMVANLISVTSSVAAKNWYSSFETLQNQVNNFELFWHHSEKGNLVIDNTAFSAKAPSVPGRQIRSFTQFFAVHIVKLRTKTWKEKLATDMFPFLLCPLFFKIHVTGHLSRCPRCICLLWYSGFHQRCMIKMKNSTTRQFSEDNNTCRPIS